MTSKSTIPLQLAPKVATSRSDPKPNFTLSKKWEPEPRAKPGRKKAVAIAVASGSGEVDSAKKLALKQAKEKQQKYISELEGKVKSLEQRGELELLRSRQTQQELRVENDGLRQIIKQQRDEIGRFRRELSIIGSGSGHRIAPTEQPEGIPNSKRSRNSSNSIHATSPLLHQDSPSPVSSLGRSFAPLSPLAAAGESAPCGFCSSDTSSNCFCSDVGYNIDHSKAAVEIIPSPLLNNVLPTFPSSISLPLRSRISSGKPSTWHLDAPIAPPTCSGNPASCPACKDDPFGKAFCASLSDAVCSSNPCENCPRSRTSTSTSNSNTTIISPDIFQKTLADLPCCGDSNLCGSLTCGPNVDNILPLSVPAGIRSIETVPCNEAWSALKEHPNIGFADLRMLADVVSKRTFCDGPIDITSTNSRPSTSTPSYSYTSSSKSNPSSDINDRFMLVPHQTLVCAADAGRRKRLTVEREAVNDALNILDRAVGRGGPLMK